MRLRSPKANQLLSLPQWYVYASFKKIHLLVQKIFHLQDYDLENEVKATKDKTYHKPVTMIYPCKSEEYPSVSKRNMFISFLVEI